MEGAHDAVVTASGLAAITNSLCAVVKQGDHILLSDSVYRPTRVFCDHYLKRFGIESSYYDPLIGGQIRELVRPNTRVIFLESPGSQTFEIQDIPAITSVGREHDVITIIDNTWGTPVYFNPFAHGVDISVHAATKYITGHSDAMLGVICTNERWYETVRKHVHLSGECAGPEVIYLGLRGLRTMPTRLKQHYQSGLEVANWLANRPEVARVIHPALPGDQGYDIWHRDFTGACGLFAFILNPVTESSIAALLDTVKLFGMGFSWGGFESLLIPFDPAEYRTATTWIAEGPAMRIHIGLEDTADLIEDLEAGFEAMNRGARFA